MVSRDKNSNFNIPIVKPAFNEHEIELIRETLSSGWVAGQGPKNLEFAEKLERYLEVNNVIPVSSCTAGLHLGLLALGIKTGDEVVVSDYTFPATGHAVIYCGARPVFADIEMETYNISPESLESRMNSKTRAIIPVHSFGHPARIDEIKEIAGEHQIQVLDDAACAIGSLYKGKKIGSFFDITAFSFHARKTITTGEGGALATNNCDFADSIRQLMNFGLESALNREKSNEFTIPVFAKLGFNYKLSDIAAAIGIGQLKKLDKVIKRKNKLADYFSEQLSEIDQIKPPTVIPGVRHSYQSYVVLVKKNSIRNKLLINLRKWGIGCQIGTYTSCIQPVYQHLNPDHCLNSINVFERSLALPMFPDLSFNQMDVIVEKIKDIMGN